MFCCRICMNWSTARITNALHGLKWKDKAGCDAFHTTLVVDIKTHKCCGMQCKLNSKLAQNFMHTTKHSSGAGRCSLFPEKSRISNWQALGIYSSCNQRLLPLSMQALANASSDSLINGVIYIPSFLVKLLRFWRNGTPWCFALHWYCSVPACCYDLYYLHSCQRVTSSTLGKLWVSSSFFRVQVTPRWPRLFMNCFLCRDDQFFEDLSDRTRAVALSLPTIRLVHKSWRWVSTHAKYEY